MTPVGPFLLSRHVHVCVCADHYVLLDLRRDRYLGLSKETQGTLSRWIEGWSQLSATAASSAPTSTAMDERSEEFPPENVHELLNDGVLTDDRARGKLPLPVNIDLPVSALIEGYSDTRPDITAADVFTTLWAAARAAALLKFRSLEAVAGHVHARRLRHSTQFEALRATRDLESVRQRVAKFIRLRPLFFSAHNECLFDSLALNEYLAWHGIFPNWVFGVTTGPFAAHCWLQAGNTILNDHPDNVLKYQPILVL